jgi:hypothetical protein
MRRRAVEDELSLVPRPERDKRAGPEHVRYLGFLVEETNRWTIFAGESK